MGLFSDPKPAPKSVPPRFFRVYDQKGFQIIVDISTGVNYLYVFAKDYGATSHHAPRPISINKYYNPFIGCR